MGDNDKSLEQQVSEDLAELKAQETPEDCRLSKALAELEALKRTVHALKGEMVDLKGRLDRQLPVGSTHNCRYCGRILRTPKGKCHVCGKQN
jgi:rubrerythrin